MQVTNYDHRMTPQGLAGLRAILFCIQFALFVTVTPVRAQIRSEKPELIKVNDRIYVATGYALGNMISIITNDSLVVIDTTESPTVAGDILAQLRKITDKPIRRIIYTHFHGDHVNGTRLLMADHPQVIAQELHTVEMQKYRALALYNRRLNGLQFGFTLAPEERGISLAPEVVQGVIGYVFPTVTFDKELKFEEGGVRFELYHAPGETNDHLIVWLPDEKALFPGDLYYNSFPMLASPMKPDRPIAEWAHSLERMREFHPEYLVPSHSGPVRGAANVDEVLKNYAAAIQYLNTETIKGLNGGLTLDQIKKQIKLPKNLAGKSYLQPLYGRLEWAINGAYRNYTGWYDFNPTHLNPASPAAVSKTIVEAAGGTAPLVSKVEELSSDGNWQMVLELTEIILSAEPQNPTAHTLRAAALNKLADAAVSGVERNIYRAAAKEHHDKADAKTAGVAE